MIGAAFGQGGHMLEGEGGQGATGEKGAFIAQNGDGDHDDERDGQKEPMGNLSSQLEHRSVHLPDVHVFMEMMERAPGTSG